MATTELDKFLTHEDAEEEAKRDPARLGSKRKFDEFECPTCSAHNPYGDGFGNGEEVNCGYCGQAFLVEVDSEGQLKLREA
jgi:hypothetical protein